MAHGYQYDHQSTTIRAVPSAWTIIARQSEWDKESTVKALTKTSKSADIKVTNGDNSRPPPVYEVGASNCSGNVSEYQKNVSNGHQENA